MTKEDDKGVRQAKQAEHRNGSAGHGRGARALGLKPGKHVSAEKFEKLLKGHAIGTDVRLGRLRDGEHEHRPGFDITFSAPKSVSLAALLPTEKHPCGDRGAMRAHGGGDRDGLADRRIAVPARRAYSRRRWHPSAAVSKDRAYPCVHGLKATRWTRGGGLQCGVTLEIGQRHAGTARP